MQKLDILYEDNHVIAVIKPVNVPTQEDRSGDLDMLTWIKEDLKVRYQKPGNVYLGLIHRLDRPVGGTMLFAKTSKAASRLSDQIRTRAFQKYYIAIVRGEPKVKQQELIDYLKKNQRTNTTERTSAHDPEAKKAILTYTAGETKQGLTLVAIKLKTGRPHQIRVQLAGIGCPLYGDQKYGANQNQVGQQIALWSSKIGFLHPTQKERQSVSCLPPSASPWSLWSKDEMLRLLDKLSSDEEIT